MLSCVSARSCCSSLLNIGRKIGDAVRSKASVKYSRSTSNPVIFTLSPTPGVVESSGILKVKDIVGEKHRRLCHSTIDNYRRLSPDSKLIARCEVFGRLWELAIDTWMLFDYHEINFCAPIDHNTGSRVFRACFIKNKVTIKHIDGVKKDFGADTTRIQLVGDDIYPLMEEFGAAPADTTCRPRFEVLPLVDRQERWVLEGPKTWPSAGRSF